MTTFPKYLRPLEIAALILLARQRAEQEAQQSGNVCSITDFDYGAPEDIDLAVETLSKEAAIELTALMWLGRGASGEKAADWPNLMRQATDQNIGKTDVDYIAGKMPLHEYIEAGLKKMNYEISVEL